MAAERGYQHKRLIGQTFGRQDARWQSTTLSKADQRSIKAAVPAAPRRGGWGYAPSTEPGCGPVFPSAPGPVAKIKGNRDPETADREIEDGRRMHG
jgi:hypothetical protein